MGWPGGISRLDIPTIPPSKSLRRRSSCVGVACFEVMPSEEGSPEDVLGLPGASLLVWIELISNCLSMPWGFPGPSCVPVRLALELPGDARVPVWLALELLEGALGLHGAYSVAEAVGATNLKP